MTIHEAPLKDSTQDRVFRSLSTHVFIQSRQVDDLFLPSDQQELVLGELDPCGKDRS